MRHGGCQHPFDAFPHFAALVLNEGRSSPPRLFHTSYTASNLYSYHLFLAYGCFSEVRPASLIIQMINLTLVQRLPCPSPQAAPSPAFQQAFKMTSLQVSLVMRFLDQH